MCKNVRIYIPTELSLCRPPLTVGESCLSSHLLLRSELSQRNDLRSVREDDRGVRAVLVHLAGVGGTGSGGGGGEESNKADVGGRGGGGSGGGVGGGRGRKMVLHGWSHVVPVGLAAAGAARRVKGAAQRVHHHHCGGTGASGLACRRRCPGRVVVADLAAGRRRIAIGRRSRRPEALLLLLLPVLLRCCGGRGGCGKHSVLHGECRRRESGCDRRRSRRRRARGPDDLPPGHDKGEVRADRAGGAGGEEGLLLGGLVAAVGCSGVAAATGGRLAVALAIDRVAAAAAQVVTDHVAAVRPGDALDGGGELHLAGYDKVDSGALEKAGVGASVAGQQPAPSSSAAAGATGAAWTARPDKSTGNGAEKAALPEALAAVAALENEVEDEYDNDGEDDDDGGAEPEDVLNL